MLVPCLCGLCSSYTAAYDGSGDVTQDDTSTQMYEGKLALENRLKKMFCLDEKKKYNELKMNPRRERWLHGGQNSKGQAREEGTVG